MGALIVGRRRVLIVLVALAATATACAADDGPSFDKVVAPLLAEHCLGCHSGPRPKGGLDLADRASALRGGKHGKAIVPGNIDASLAWERVADGSMPPKKPLPDAAKAVLRNWIAAGAPWDVDPIDPLRYTTGSRAGYDWWSLQPLAAPPLPTVKSVDWACNGIDRFVLAMLEGKGLAPSAPADRRTLIRRVTFDLRGLPPTPEEIDVFLGDAGSGAYEKVVDRLLASPQYGERWARHWLDVVRFGESHGFEHDELRRNAWPYRDWVVQALNRDLPYDEFVRLQLAGDVLRPGDTAALAATGFLVAGAYDSVGQSQQSAAMKAVVREDELEDLAGTVGQTFLGLTVHCARCHDHKFDPVRQSEYYRLTAALAGVRHPGPAAPKLAAYAVAPGRPEIGHVLLRGDPAQKGAVVTPGALAALRGMAPDFGLAADAGDGPRRAKLAAWVTDGQNPLFARVIVNRLWQHHFGIGIVDTPSDLGFNGGRPSHPALLDWLAGEMRRRGWSLKEMHRLIVTSKTYRQASRWNPTAARLDADNRLLWRKSPMRLEAEAVRDAMLFVSGTLNPAMDGPGYEDFKLNIRGATHEYTPVDIDTPAVHRRSLYRTWARSGRNKLLDTFDCPDPSTVAPSRAVTTTPLQALTLLNNAFVLRMADRFAGRLRREAGDNTNRQIVHAYRLAYGRDPRPPELKTARQAVDTHGLAVLCRAIFNSSEFLYVD
jgi:hypothetical protein